MARTVLDEAEFKGLILRIINKGHALSILDWMRAIPDKSPSERHQEVLKHKNLGYQDYNLCIDTFDTDFESVTEARFHLWRKARAFSGRQTQKTLDAIRHLVFPRYRQTTIHRTGTLYLEGAPIENSQAYIYGGEGAYGGELRLMMERSRGWTPHGHENCKHDIISFEFKRRFD